MPRKFLFVKYMTICSYVYYFREITEFLEKLNKLDKWEFKKCKFFTDSMNMYVVKSVIIIC